MTKTAALTVEVQDINGAEPQYPEQPNTFVTSAVVVDIGSRAKAKQSTLDQISARSQPKCSRRTCPAMEHGCALFPSGCVSIYRQL